METLSKVYTDQLPVLNSLHDPLIQLLPLLLGDGMRKYN